MNDSGATFSLQRFTAESSRYGTAMREYADRRES
jgi:hypothetical protein